MIKLSIAIAGSDALPSAFVVFRGFEESIQKAARLGFDGVELALKSAEEINPAHLSKWLNRDNLSVSCISTGQVYADTGLMFTHKEAIARKQVIKIFHKIIDLAADFGKKVNIGRVRGQIGKEHPSIAKERFIKIASDLCNYALNKNVTLILEPVNRYEIDFINSVEEGMDLLKTMAVTNMKLMPDTFHMNIEDPSIGQTLADNIEDICYIHFADSNRLAPGQGHIDFIEILSCLKQSNYDGWISLEILPKPDPETAAKQGAEFLIPLIKEYNQTINS